MKRFIFILLVLAMVSLMAAPISAKKGGIPGPPDDAPRVSVTCVSPWWEGDFETDDFTIEITREAPDACVDVLSQVSGKWIVNVEVVEGAWSRPELMMVPRDAAWADWPSDSCGGEKRYGQDVFEEWRLPPEDDARGFDMIPAATVNACPGNDATSVGGGGVGEWQERVERAENVKDFTNFSEVKKSQGPVVETEIVQEADIEVHPLAFVVWSHNLRKGDRIRISVDLPEPPMEE